MRTRLCLAALFTSLIVSGHAVANDAPFSLLLRCLRALLPQSHLCAIGTKAKDAGPAGVYKSTKTPANSSHLNGNGTFTLWEEGKVMPVRNLQLQHHDRDDDGDHRIRQELETAFETAFIHDWCPYSDLRPATS